jgi:predicted DNA-binding transcriptional regulator AlpA
LADYSDVGREGRRVVRGLGPISTQEPTEITPLCVDRAGLAAILGVSVRQVDRLDSGAKLPAPLTFGRCKRWSVGEVKAWIASGAPPRSRWNASRNLRSSLALPREHEQGHTRA